LALLLASSAVLVAMSLCCAFGNELCVTSVREPASRSNANLLVAVLISTEGPNCDTSPFFIFADLVAFTQCLTGVDEVVVWPQPKNM
jgi:hypothetical protein